MKLGLLCSGAGINCPACAETLEITKIVSDSRQACEGCLFVCIRGLHYDGHLFIREALNAGASVIITEDGTRYEFNAFAISVTDTRQSLACLFDAWYGFPSQKMKYIAVTGTNGKTSVTYVLKSIFESALYRCGLIGTVSCLSQNRRLFSGNGDKLANMTTPDPEQLYAMLAEMVNDGIEYVFIEATSHALRLGKLAPLHFCAAVFTNLTPEHLDFHGSMENYLAAKKKLFAMCDIAVINMDSEYYNDIARSASGKVVTCSASGRAADYRAASITDLGIDGISYTLCSAKTVVRVRSHIPGRFSVMNTLEAAACAAELGIRPVVISGAVASVTGIDGRLEKIKLGTADYSVFIDYAHTPDALENLLESVRGFRRTGQRIVVVFGCGGDRDKSKRPVMGEIATRLADLAVITSDNCRSEDPDAIIADILTGISGRDNFKIVPDRRRAIEQSIAEARTGDIIILAGKGHEMYEINHKGRIPFCEKDIVLTAVGKRCEDRYSD